MRRVIRRWREATDGASAVEFAIVATPLLVILFASVEFGRLQWTRAALQKTAIAGARCMGVKQSACTTGGAVSTAQTRSFVQSEALAWSVSVPTSAITVDASVPCSGVANFSRVQISYVFQTAVPLLLGSLASGVQVGATACFPNQS